LFKKNKECIVFRMKWSSVGKRKTVHHQIACDNSVLAVTWAFVCPSRASSVTVQHTSNHPHHPTCRLEGRTLR
jgi:hypothetical protein